MSLPERLTNFLKSKNNLITILKKDKSYNKKRIILEEVFIFIKVS
jgi:hypothetical protein